MHSRRSHVHVPLTPQYLASTCASPQAKKTPHESALQIGEENAAKLIEALLDGKSGDDIGKGEDDLLDIGDGSGDEETPAPSDRSGAKAKGKTKEEQGAEKGKKETTEKAVAPAAAKEEPAAAKANDAPYPVAADA